MKKSLLIFILVAAVGLLAAQWIIAPDRAAVSKRQFDERVNLALRQAGHQLLILMGDHTSAIPPVRQLAENEFELRLENNFEYDSLPALLTKAFADFGITENFQLAVKNCQTDELVLGFNSQAILGGMPACRGRDQLSDCNNISVTFPHLDGFGTSDKWLQIALGAISILLLLRLLFFRKKEKEIINAVSENYSTKEKEVDGILKIGNSKLDVKNQLFRQGSFQKELTFREAKLFHFFATHPNQLLEREQILNEVWGDEGVIVGRSLDVFVSRIRKMIADDISLKIKTVHGVGYRLEVQGSPGKIE